MYIHPKWFNYDRLQTPLLWIMMNNRPPWNNSIVLSACAKIHNRSTWELAARLQTNNKAIKISTYMYRDQYKCTLKIRIISKNSSKYFCVSAKNWKENSEAGLCITCEKDYRKASPNSFIHFTGFQWSLFFILLFDLDVRYFSYILSVVLQTYSQR